MRTPITTLVALVLIAGMSPAFAKVTNVRHDIEARYAAILTAAKAKNWDELRAILAPDYRSLDIDGQGISRDTEIAQDQEAPDVSNERSRIDILSLKLDGDRAEVEQAFSSHFTEQGDDGKAHRIAVVALSSDIWRKTDGKWLCVQTVTTQSFVTVDGQPAAHDVASPAVA